MPFERYRRDRAAWDTLSTGEPEAFTILPNRTLRLFPTPDAAHAIAFEYYKGGVRLVGNADVPLLPERFHEVIIVRGRIYWATFENAQAELQVASALYGELMLQLEASETQSFENSHGKLAGNDILVRPE